MIHIYLNLKRFDIPRSLGGVNSLAPVEDWAKRIVEDTQAALSDAALSAGEYVMFFPEAHLLNAAAAKGKNSPIRLGCQGVHREDTSIGGNFGAFTTLRTANAAGALGCECALIGHCEERREKAGVLAEAGVSDTGAVNRLLNKEILSAQNAGLDVLYCVGESEAEQPRWQEVLGEQLEVGLAGADTARVAIAYEPIWSIGPGKTPADAPYITKVARFIKERVHGVDVVYGGGLKKENAAMLAEIPEVDGGLIALTRFSGEIGFYPDEYLEIIRLYMEARG